MTPLHLPFVLMAAALATVLLAACGRDDADADAPAATTDAPAATSETAGATDAPAPGAPAGNDAGAGATPSALPTTSTPPLSVTAVDVGSAIGADDRVTTAATTFDREDTVYVSVATDGDVDNVPVTAKWTSQDGEVIDTETRIVEHAGPAVTAFRVYRPNGWPSGRYRVEVSVADRVLQTREFTVR